MSQDTLSNVLRAVRLRGAVFYFIDGSSPWMAEAPPAKEIIPAIMPGAEHMIEFHGVVAGACWAAIVGEQPVRLAEGDVVLFPQGDPHVMSSAPGMRSPRVDKDMFFVPRPPQLPHTLSAHGSELTTARLDGGGGDRATIVCGFLGLDARPFNPVLAALPRVLHVPRAVLGPDSWVASFLRAAVVESNQKRPGGEAVLERMSEMLFVEVLRRYVESLPEGQTGWLAGMRDPAIGRVLALLHEKPEADWTLERLAEDAAMSRSTLHERFVHFIGQPPMQYLTQWRMQVAAGLLRDTKSKLIEVALGVGYESEAAFSRAFKRAVGIAPGRLAGRAQARSPGGAPVTPAGLEADAERVVRAAEAVRRAGHEVRVLRASLRLGARRARERGGAQHGADGEDGDGEFPVHETSLRAGIVRPIWGERACRVRRPAVRPRHARLGRRGADRRRDELEATAGDALAAQSPSPSWSSWSST